MFKRMQSVIRTVRTVRIHRIRRTAHTVRTLLTTQVSSKRGCINLKFGCRRLKSVTSILFLNKYNYEIVLSSVRLIMQKLH